MPYWLLNPGLLSTSLQTALLARWMKKVEQTAMTDQALNLQYRRGLLADF
jgi:hypothetical protein